MAERVSTDEAQAGAVEKLTAIAFFAVVAVSMLGWIGFLIWIMKALSGF